MTRYEKESQRNKKVATTSYVTQMEQITSYSLKMMQPRTTGTCHQTLSNFFFPFSYEVVDQR